MQSNIVYDQGPIIIIDKKIIIGKIQLDNKMKKQ